MDEFLSHREVQVSDFEKVCKIYDVRKEVGLSTTEGEKRFEKFGPNELPEEPSTPWWKIVLAGFEDRMVQILLGAALISFFMAISSGEVHDLVEPLVIVIILVLNTLVGFWQESSAEAAIKELKSLAPSVATVIRNGVTLSIPAREVVLGDLIEVSVGQRIPADARVTELLSTTLRVDQSLLTGESVEVVKHAGIESDSVRFAANILFSGTNVTYGKARAIVTAIGTKTEIGTIEGAVRSVEAVKTPLQRKLDEFSELLSKVIGIICILVFVVNILRFLVFAEEDHGYLTPVLHSLKLAISLAVAAIPEGLPAVVTTCLALGTRRMAKRNALVRSLPSVETLGCCNIICSDKTGTLTTNMMSVSLVYTVAPNRLPTEYNVAETQFEVVPDSISSNGELVKQPLAGDKALEQIATICALCNDASLEVDTKTRIVKRLGDATEAALLVLSEKLAEANYNYKEKELIVKAHRESISKKFKKNATLEFTRERKSMSVHCSSGKDHFLFVKGAPESVLDRCTHVHIADGSVTLLDAKIKATLREKLVNMSSHALRCLALAYKTCPAIDKIDVSNPNNFHLIEDKLVFCGIVGMLDPPRMEVSQAISDCYKAGIRVVVITGDSKETAESICKKIGILEGGQALRGKSFTGAEFYALSKEEQEAACKTACLFSRVDPALKCLLVSILQKQKKICAMTGDGVNDAPALKRADIGIAMGTGTEVAKAASKMILADDNFSTIIVAISEGRAIYNNTKQFIRYLISSNIGEVVCIFTTGLLGLPDALEPVQLLWVNLVTDGLPATALGFNPPDPDIMEVPPRDSSEPIVNGWLFTRYLIIGIYVGLATIGGFMWWFFAHGYTFQEIVSPKTCVPANSLRCAPLHEPREARAVALSVLVVVEMFNALNAISENESILRFPPYKNMWLILAIFSSLTLHFLIMYVPFLCYIFNVAPLGVSTIDPRNLERVPNTILIPDDFTDWEAIIALSFPVILLDEALKFVTRFTQKSKKQ